MADNEPEVVSLAAGGEPSGNSEAPAQGTQTQPTTEMPDWVKRLDGFDEKARSNLSRFKTEKDVAKSWLEAQSRLGRSAVIPGDDASPKDWEEFRKRLGRPEKPDDYELEEAILPAGIKRLQGDEEYKKIAHQVGLTKEQAKALHKANTLQVLEALKYHEGELKRKRDEASAELKKEFGDDYKKNLGLAQKVGEKFAGKDWFEFVNQTGAGNHPAMIRFLVNIGKQMSEDTLETGRVAESKTERTPGVLDYSGVRPELRRTGIRSVQ